MTIPSDPPAADTATSLRLYTGETLGAGLYRVTAVQFRIASVIVGAEDPAGTVHETRKAVKRLRTLLRLVRPAIPRPIFRRDDSVLSAAARAVGSIRDEWVMAALLDDLAASVPDAAAAAMRYREGFLYRAAGFVADAPAFDRLRTALIDLDDRSHAWYDGTYREGHEIAHSFNAVAPGLHGIYRRARSAWHSVRSDPTIPLLHRWRRRAKYFRHAVEAFHVIDPPRLSHLEASLTALTDELGNDHDLAVLAARIGTDAVIVPETRIAIGAEIEKRRRTLVAAAMESGTSLFGSTPDELCDDLGASWRAGPAF